MKFHTIEFLADVNFCGRRERVISVMHPHQQQWDVRLDDQNRWVSVTVRTGGKALMTRVPYEQVAYIREEADDKPAPLRKAPKEGA